MNKKMVVVSLVILVIIIGLLFSFIFDKNNNKILNKDENNEINSVVSIDNISNIENNNDVDSNIIIKEQLDNEVNKVGEIYIKVNNNILNVKLEDNDSTKALIQKLKETDIVVDAREYGDFEKVGSLDFSLPRNDKNIKTVSGDIMLYQGNQVTIFYGSNSWSYTKLGKIQNTNENELRNILGNGDVKLVFSINK